MTKIEECYANFFGFLNFLRFAHTSMIFVVYNYNELNANSPANVCRVGRFKSRFWLWFLGCFCPNLFLLPAEYLLRDLQPFQAEERGQLRLNA